ncbi:MAG: 16S rRNA (cytidine(1402)-2'-O)-methyltransferase [Pseudomonadota bacterium]|nr:16S rRNA (cytidine(1402)-2'-O)-methyltransferase [Pseudomonadota bacterium]MEC9235487.1 16S rRNA (cytidine(1402)-2'-O)-methyltransferase [Pseudomonadota bacterium]MED5422834.1 16S rRNA (cytidine(1402)-2'-O)-methyltransferase [Pseudomonadota bacterium]
MVNPAQHSSANHFVSGLYLVATPIGNLQDITLRALDLLKSADLIACEDTRVSGKLLSHFGIKAPLLSYNDHSDERKRDKICAALEDNKIVALISDAGMPLISDPGYKLVQYITQKGYYITSLPGASAPLMALQLSALPSDKFCFLGFIPSKNKARADLFTEWKNIQATLIAFETAPRLLATLKAIHEIYGDRAVAIARELTKKFEEVKRNPVSALIQNVEENGPPKGEIVLVIAPPNNTDKAEYTEDEIESLLKQHLKQYSLRESVDMITELTGRKRKDIYQQALDLKDAE